MARTPSRPPRRAIDKEFSIAGSENVRLLKVSLDWATPDDYDLEIYLKQPDGTLKDMGGSGGPPGAKEIAYIEDARPATMSCVWSTSLPRTRRGR